LNGGSDCAGFAAGLYAGLRGELPPTEAEALRSHLLACPACAAEERQSRALAVLLGSLPEVDPAPDAFARLRARIEAGETSAPPRRHFRLVLPLLAAAAAAILLLLLRPSAPSPRLTAVHPATAGGLTALRFTGTRTVDLILAPDTMVEPDGPSTLRVAAGRVYAEVRPGPGRMRFLTPHARVEVTGTKLVLEVREAGTRVSVVEGAVTVRADGADVPLAAGSGVDVGPGAAAAPFTADVWRTRDWCSAPTATLAVDPEDPGILTFRLANPTPSPLTVRRFDPSDAVYSLAIGGRDGTLSTVLRGPMVTGGARHPGEEACRVLAPGETYAVSFDPAKLGLAPGEYGISAVYRPYGLLPPEAWRGNLATEPVRVTVK
jgi:ferric-dicitrate binding protein FerR (iron transport regulator)